MENFFPTIIDSWERYLDMEGRQKQDAFAENFDHYVRALWLASLAIVFEVDRNLFARALSCVGNVGQDGLFERLVSTRVAGRPMPEKLVWPKHYQLLSQAIDAPVQEKPPLFKKFLKGWYRSMRGVYWHDNHKGPEGGGFFGYWCIEAAGVVMAFRIDDSAFRDMPYYPKDLVRR